MTIWPFGRKNSRKKSSLGLKTSATEPTTMKRVGSREAGRLNGSEVGAAGELSRKRTGRERRRRSRESKKLQRDPPKRNYSYSPARSENLGVRRDGRAHPPLPDNAVAIVARSAFAAKGRAQTEDLGRVPTLHKRTAQDLNRRKSSKKRKEDHDRAAEIKAMSKFMPTPMRAATTPDWSGSPIRRDTKKLHGLTRLFTSTTSDVSLPIPDSLRSSISSDSERFATYELKGMDLFTPRPTIRYSENPKFKQYESGVGIERSNSSKRKRALEKVPVPEEKPAYRKRIDDLADGLDAGALRELMERDNRRREQRRTSEREAMAQRARRKERQKAEESQAIIHGNEPAKIMDRGVMGRELMGLGIEGQKPVEAPAQQSTEPATTTDGAADVRNGAPESGAQNVPAGILVNGSLPSPDLESPASEQSEPVLATAQVARLSRATMSPPPSLQAGHHRNASSVSQINDLPAPPKSTELPAPIPAPIPQVEHIPAELSKQDTSRTSFDTGSSKQHSSWKSWFTRNSKEKRSSIQSSFSNTTRESTVAPPPATVIYAIPIVHPPGPKRTMSRFREDLPELPMSPPYSRVQSPELDIMRVQPIERSLPMNITSGRKSAEPPSQMQLDTSSGHRSHLRYETPTGEHPADVPSPEPSNALSQSLASIDSEGSWLSGRARANSKRSSRQIPPTQSRDSHSSLVKRYRNLSDSAEELGIAEGEYYNRLTPGPDDMYSKTNMANRISGNPMPSSDEEDGESLGSPVSKSSKWGEVAHTPTIVHREPRAALRQGRLNDFQDYDSGDDEKLDSPLSPPKDGVNSETAESPVTPVGGGGLDRATSIDYKKAHMRAVSAGSARLLDLKPRASGESKRTSIG
ncbi:hypothetical protein VC83_06672 [Pseudogymnoascus destructans]|uniref:Uncharacterized protein n=2 Tax=Pseudogymnoascus destructans TaxID=655981 RepID=L8G9G3_PSED2|nr:uncharacterized protein VC83_06672 [Pseudogymnoascus destructans]ELR09288.1 hypothetical protein GMDG_03856 [Pseudogymnoascus destructans 20631-21]OAF56321.1 hypothetical protein VC83_06672 [Pseudogymnoascus destructans]